jgi:hypothetical protein
MASARVPSVRERQPACPLEISPTREHGDVFRDGEVWGAAPGPELAPNNGIGDSRV